MGLSSLCEYLDWDSNFFERRIARATVGNVDDEAIREILAWCHEKRIDCLYFLAKSDDPTTTRILEEQQFRLVDIRVTLENKLDSISAAEKGNADIVVRLSDPVDISALRAIAKTSYRNSRFYFDGNFPITSCDALYETWIEKSCNGYADGVLVALIDQKPVGYVSCHLLDPLDGQIGLVGIRSDCRGAGLGQKLLGEAIRWFTKHRREKIIVVTQGRNVQGQRLYQRCGFLLTRVELWYHRWFHG